MLEEALLLRVLENASHVSLTVSQERSLITTSTDDIFSAIIRRLYNKELSPLILLLKGPKTSLIDNLYSIYLRCLIETPTRCYVIHHLDVENVFISLLSAEMHVSLWGKSIDRLKIVNSTAEPESRHFTGLWLALHLCSVVDLITNQELDLIVLHKTGSKHKRQDEFTAFFDPIEEPHS